MQCVRCRPPFWLASHSRALPSDAGPLVGGWQLARMRAALRAPARGPVLGAQWVGELSGQVSSWQGLDDCLNRGDILSLQSVRA